MGRKKDPCWEYVEKLNDKLKCKFCGVQFAGGASRIKGHLSGIKGKGILTCTNVPKHVQVDCLNSNHDVMRNDNLRNVNSSYPEVDCLNSNQIIMRNIHSDDPGENFLNSNESLNRNSPSTNLEEDFLNADHHSVMGNIYSSYSEENFLNSTENTMTNINSYDLEENFLNSEQSISGNVNSGDSSKGKSITGRRKDRFWQYVEPGLNGRVKCTFCGHEFFGGASRIKWHLSKMEKMGVDICGHVPEDIQIAAYDASSKRLKRNIDFSHNAVNFVDSNSLSRSSKGNSELYRIPTGTDFIGQQFQSYIDKIWGWLMNGEESVIGVCGMGGVGKTTLLKHIYNKLLDASHHVIWVSTVPKDNTIFRLQKIIAESFDWHISDEDDKIKVTARLFHTLNEAKKCVIILDGVWDDIPLERVGIPLMDSGAKVIVATRLFDVCRTVGCKGNILKVEPLCEDEDDSFDLFYKVLGKDESFFPDEVREIVASILEECEGLPLAIVTIARSMRGKEDITEWEYILENLINLEKGQDEMKKHVFPVLKLSYIHLNDKILQECLLLCALHVIDRTTRPDWVEDVSKQKFITHFVEEGLINRNDSLEAQFDEGHIILNKFINSNLLFEVDHYSVHFHRLVWAMAVSNARESGYMMKISENLREALAEQQWKEDLQKFWLFDIEEIPSGTSPKFPRLSTLVLCGSYPLKVIPNDFFINMPSLKVLKLSMNIEIEHLPRSISNLESLTALLIACPSLKYVPSLAKLHKLERLDLSCTDITELPLGLDMLINLRWLNLEGTEKLIISRPSMIPRLTNLRVLLLDAQAFALTGGVKVEDLEGLKSLESISVSFNDGNEFNSYVRIVGNAQNRGLRNYCLHLTGLSLYIPIEVSVYDSNKTILFKGIGYPYNLLLPVDMNVLIIICCENWRSLCDVLSFDDKNNSKSCKIKKCKISYCDELEHIFCSSSSCSFCSSLESLEMLTLGPLENLSMLCKETT